MPSGEFVVLTRIYRKQRLAECLWQGLIGLFSLDDLQIVQNSKTVQDEEKNVLVHTTPPRKPFPGGGTHAEMSQRSNNKNTERSRPEMRVLQPSDMNRGIDEEMKGNGPQEERNNTYRDENGFTRSNSINSMVMGMGMSQPKSAKTMMKGELVNRENLPEPPDDSKFGERSGPKRRLSIFSNYD